MLSKFVGIPCSHSAEKIESPATALAKSDLATILFRDALRKKFEATKPTGNIIEKFGLEGGS